MLVIALTSFANMYGQYEGTYFDQRIGHGSDSIEIRQNVAMFYGYLENKDYLGAYKYWKYLMDYAPIARLDTYTQGAYMLENLIEASNDKATKRKYLNELMDLYDTLLKNADFLNQCADIKPKTTRGPVLCRKAYDYARYAEGVYDDYSIEKAYNNFTEGIYLTSNDSNEEIEAFVIIEFFQTSYRQYTSNKSRFKNQFSSDYTICKGLCERMLSKAKNMSDRAKAEKMAQGFEVTRDYIKYIYTSSPTISNAGQIVTFDMHDANVSNLSYNVKIDVANRRLSAVNNGYTLFDIPFYGFRIYKEKNRIGFALRPNDEAAIDLSSQCYFIIIRDNGNIIIMLPDNKEYLMSTNNTTNHSNSYDMLIHSLYLQINTPTLEKTDEDKIYEVAEVQPEFPGGMDALMMFLEENIQYPPNAQKNGIQGSVVIKFVVGLNGEITDVKIAKALDPECDKEAVRVIKMMPRWKPAMQNNKPVKCRFSVPVRFKIIG